MHIIAILTSGNNDTTVFFIFDMKQQVEVEYSRSDLYGKIPPKPNQHS